LAELYAVMTRLPQPVKVLPEEAQALITDLMEYLSPVSLLSAEYESAIAGMVKFQLTGGGIFDALIAQAALKAKVDCLITLNPKDFTRLGEEIAPIVQVPPESRAG
jgi:predicted nucleic acid-binding protein